MGLVTGSWERPIQGVSQQSDKDRINGQCTLQENFTPSPLYGLVKRVGTRHIAKILANVHPNSYWYQYSRGNNENYFVVIEPNQYPRVFDSNGVERTVNAQSVNDAYVKVSNPKKSFALRTVADFTFIANKDVVVKKRGDRESINPKMAIVYLQYATYGRDYTIKIDGKTLATYKTPNGADAKVDPPFIRTNYIMEELSKQVKGTKLVKETRPLVVTHQGGGSGSGVTTHTISLTQTPLKVLSAFNQNTNRAVNVVSVRGSTITTDSHAGSAGDSILVNYQVTAASNFNTEVHGNTMYITKKDNTSFSIETIDSADGNDLIAIQDRVRELVNLPPHAPDNYIVEVQSQEGYAASSYWLKAVPNADNQTGSKVRWEESLAQGALKGLNKDTLPHQLVSEANGTFTLATGDWEDREVGNDDTNPFPSFVGLPISSIGVVQNRMMFTASEASILSRSNLFFNFFRESTQQESDSDPIDIFADTTEINNLTHHAVLDGDVVFFSENGQFVMKGDKPLTKSTAILKKATSFPINVVSNPAITGESIMIPYSNGGFTGVRELFTDSFTDTKRARPITEHVSEYIVGQAERMVSSPNINTMLVLTPENLKEVYVYDWLWSGDQRVQSAFHKWVFTGEVLYSTFIGEYLYFVIRRNDGIFLEYMPISSDVPTNDIPFEVHLDQRAVITAQWTGLRWEWDSLPYQPDSLEQTVFVRATGCWEDDIGTSVIVETDGSKYWSYDDLADVMGGATTCTLMMGTPYMSKYVPTKPYLKDRNDHVMGLDRLTIGQVFLNYEKIGNIQVVVTDKPSKRQWKYNYNGRMFGSWNNRVGLSPQDSGQFPFPIRLVSENASFEVSTDDYKPFVLRDMEWKGMFKQRGRRY